jgi:hypothetical protein
MKKNDQIFTIVFLSLGLLFFSYRIYVHAQVVGVDDQVGRITDERVIALMASSTLDVSQATEVALKEKSDDKVLQALYHIDERLQQIIVLLKK